MNDSENLFYTLLLFSMTVDLSDNFVVIFNAFFSYYSNRENMQLITLSDFK